MINRGPNGDPALGHRGPTDYQGVFPSAAPTVNAGKSRIWGFEVDAAVKPFEGFKLDVGYTYLNTKLLSFTTPAVPIYYASLSPATAVGGPLPLSPKNRITRFIQTNIRNLAGVPSIVYGILGLTAFARLFGVFGNDEPWHVGDPESFWYFQLPFGRGALAGAAQIQPGGATNHRQHIEIAGLTRLQPGSLATPGGFTATADVRFRSGPTMCFRRRLRGDGLRNS